MALNALKNRVSSNPLVKKLSDYPYVTRIGDALMGGRPGTDEVLFPPTPSRNACFSTRWARNSVRSTFTPTSPVGLASDDVLFLN